jgi:AraC family transcriptional regulator
MRSPNGLTTSYEPKEFGCPNIVDNEVEWRALPQISGMAPSGLRVAASRWCAAADMAQEFRAETADTHHVVKVVLRTMDIRLSAAGRTVQDGVAAAGMFHVTEPAVSARCLFRGSYDVLHLHVPNDLIAECARDMFGHEQALFRSRSDPTTDPTVELLGRALLGANKFKDPFARLYADSVSMAIVSRLLASAARTAATNGPKVSKLAQWRLNRAIEYIDAHLAERVSLADVSSAAGLRPMHFAAQFRAATGLRPHEYLLRSRVKRAQDMLARTRMSVIYVALSVGFQTQAHFTTVFKRFVGQSPCAWRRSIDDKGLLD